MRCCAGVLCLLVGLVGCDGPEPFDAGIETVVDAGLDGGVDAGDPAPPDAGFDSGVDAGVDSGTDAGPPCFAFEDNDGDGYGDPMARVMVECGEPLPPTVSLTGDDCDDESSVVHPGQREFVGSATPRGSWDFNCDGAVELEYPDWASCTPAMPATGQGWVRYCTAADGPTCIAWDRDAVPACGQVGEFRGIGCSMMLRPQRCR